MEAQELIDMMDARAKRIDSPTGPLVDEIRSALVNAYLEGRSSGLHDAMKASTAAVDRAFEKAAK